jgi:hypothetical protein
MEQFRKAAMISTFVGVAMASVIGFWWFNSPLPAIEPPKLLISDGASLLDDSEARWNKDILDRFEESSLRSSSFSDRETYRLILLPTFDAPILVSASRTSDGYELTTKLLDGKGGYEMGRLASNIRRPLTESEWQRLMELIDDSSFWFIPRIDRTDDIVNDGAVWMMEGRREADLHNITRITPKAEFLEACRYFLQLAGRESDYNGY